VTKGERAALEAIRRMAGANLFRIVAPHATDVMEVYHLQHADVRFGLLDARSCRRQSNRRYRVSTRIEERDWSLIVEVEPEMVVVTLFVEGDES